MDSCSLIPACQRWLWLLHAAPNDAVPAQGAPSSTGTGSIHGKAAAASLLEWLLHCLCHSKLNKNEVELFVFFSSCCSCHGCIPVPKTSGSWSTSAGSYFSGNIKLDIAGGFFL